MLSLSVEELFSDTAKTSTEISGLFLTNMSISLRLTISGSPESMFAISGFLRSFL